ncbi:MAG: phosphomannose isomerase type II C-terminal cupin domain [Patescibacteria group bacterium]|nr:phosphomannose isomerase type II C-terminal cupin domain [Patescibacteria group bacterium]MDE2116817.1 phosphomannose isomerase type II C-terminal cupin domain [Patescibacteria group bacterium]
MGMRSVVKWTLSMTPDRLKPYREERPWGDFIEFTKDQRSTVKIVTVKKGEALSLQSHQKRDEFWHVIDGSGWVIVGNVRSAARPDDEFFVPRGTKHRLEGGSEDISVLELSFGEFDESDIVRFEDKYGRARPS